MNKKFDVVIGNPPYQEEAQGEGTRDTPLYHLFMNAAYEIADKAVLITPARFLFNAGFTPKPWNRKMLEDVHLSVPYYVPNSNALFPKTDIKGGIAVTYRDATRKIGPIGVFTNYPELNLILHKVATAGFQSLEKEITSSRSYRYAPKLYEDYPNALALRPTGNEALVATNTFEQFSFLYHTDHPEDGFTYVQVLGLAGRGRAYRWIRADYLSGPENYQKYKVVLPASNGSGVLGEVLSSPLVVGPGVGVTQTFITIGSFDDEATAAACLKYVKSKFARAMLGILKITQHNPSKVWEYVPTQNFTDKAHIDWSKPTAEIDAQLYKKYCLSTEEIEFVESNITPMA